MKTEHYPDLQRCQELMKAGFPKTYYKFVDTESDDFEDLCVIMPSVMELLDVIPRHEKGNFGINIREKWKDVFISYGIPDGCGRDYPTDTLPNALTDLVLWLISQGYRFEDGKLIK